MGKTLIVFEFADEIDSFLLQNSVDELKAKDTNILAILPESQAFLKQNNIPFLNSHDFFGKTGHINALSKSNEIYGFYENNLNLEDDLGIKKGYKISFLLYVRLYVNYLVWLIEVVSNICVQMEVNRIVCGCRKTKYEKNPLLAGKEGHAGEIAKRISSNLNISFQTFPLKVKTNYQLLSKMKKIFTESVKLMGFYLNYNFLNVKLNKKDFILASSRSYNLDRVLINFKDKYNNLFLFYLSNKLPKNLKVWFLKNNVEGFIPIPVLGNGGKKTRFVEKFKAEITKLETLSDKNNIIDYRRINFKDILFNKIKNDITSAMGTIYSQTLYMDKFLEKHKPSMIISQMARYVFYNLGELAAKYNIPSLLISHGSHVPPKNEFELIEWKEHGQGLMNTDYGYIAVQSPWANEYLNIIPTQSKKIFTGPLLFARVNKSIDDKEKIKKRIILEQQGKIILLHADTPRQRMAMRLYVYQTVDEYICSLNSLIRNVERIKDYHLIIRFRPLHYLSKEDIVPLLIQSDCYSIHSGGTFEEYLSISDMLISYSSTTIEEALQNKIPVLQYDSQGKYCHIESQILNPSKKVEVSSSYYVESEKYLFWALTWLKENHFSKQQTDLLWEKHNFKENEKTDLASYFADLFIHQKDNVTGGNL